MSMLQLEIRGMIELQRKINQMVEDLHGRGMLDGMRESARLVMNDAKRLAPVDTGRLRNSIASEIRSVGLNTIGVVGSNVIYAPYQETGTTRGVRPKRYMQTAFEQNEERIKDIIGRAIEGIISK